MRKPRAPGRSAYAGPAIHLSEPQVGWFATTLVKGGPLVPARIWRPCHCTVNGGDGNAIHDWRETCDRFPALACEVAGKPRDVFDGWELLAGRNITEDEYRFMVSDAEWCKSYAPDDPKARPNQPVNFRGIDPSTLF